MNLLKRVLFFLILVLPVLLEAGELKRIFRLLDRMEIDKAVELLNEASIEEPSHPGYKWLGAQLAVTDSLPYYDIDSALVLITEAQALYDLADSEFIEEITDLGYGKQDFSETYQLIYEKHWHRARKELTVERLNEFRGRFPASVQDPRALYLRDSLGYMQVRQLHKWQNYKRYIDRYPNSDFSDQATYYYDLLLMEERTSSDRPEDLGWFVADFPNTPYRKQIIDRILQHMLYWNDIDTLIAFAKQYASDSSARDKALSYAYHIDRSLIKESPFNAFALLDSLKPLDEMQGKPYLIYPSDGLVSILSFEDATSRKTAFTDMVGNRVYCDITSQDYFVGILNGQSVMTDLLGRPFYLGNIKAHKDVGLGVVWVQTGDHSYLLHKTGDLLADGISDASVLQNRWIKVKKDGKYGLMSLNGELICPIDYDNITVRGDFWIFKKGEKYALTNQKEIRKELGTGGFVVLFKYDELEFITDDLVIGFKGAKEALINEKLVFVIPWGDHAVYPDSEFPYIKVGDRYQLFGRLSESYAGKTVQAIKSNDHWFAIKDTAWRYIKRRNGFLVQADSVTMIGSDAIYVQHADSGRLIFKSDSVVNMMLSQSAKVLTATVNPQNSETMESYLLITGEDKQLFDFSGKRLFSIQSNDVKPLGDSLFTVKLDDGYGVLKNDTGWIVLPEYDFISRSGDMLALLKGNKIGAYDLARGNIIEPSFASIPRKSGDYYQVTQNSSVGLIDKDMNQIMPFDYREILSFGDSLYWVQTDSSWQVQSLKESRLIYYGVRSFERIEKEGDSQFKVLTSSGYGILSFAAGYLVPPTFSDIRLFIVGEEVIYIAEKSVAEADFVIWVGFDSKGNRLFSEAYRESYFEQFACD